MKLKLTRAIVFGDLESTGKDPQTDRIIQIALVRINPDGTRDQYFSLVKPAIPISPEAMAVHGITEEMVACAPLFQYIAGDIMQMLMDADFGGFNCNVFDVPMLYFELARAGQDWDHLGVNIIDVGNLFKIKERRTLEAAVKFYIGNHYEHASHDALGDTLATIDVFEKQLERYDAMPETVEAMAVYTNYGLKRADVTGKFTFNEQGEYVINFGQHKGKLARQCKDYLNWMLSKDFPKDCNAICRTILYGPKETVTSVNVDEELPF